jgi:hypothetical protein
MPAEFFVQRFGLPFHFGFATLQTFGHTGGKLKLDFLQFAGTICHTNI